MAKFKVGDKVIGSKGAYNDQKGVKGTVRELDSGSSLPIRVLYDDGVSAWEGENDVDLIRKDKPTKPKPTQFVAIYDEEDGDPAKEFTSRLALAEWLKEALEGEDIVFSSIKVFEVKRQLKVKINFSLVKV